MNLSATLLGDGQQTKHATAKRDIRRAATAPIRMVAIRKTSAGMKNMSDAMAET
jgi:hypothetical protein